MINLKFLVRKTGAYRLIIIIIIIINSFKAQFQTAQCAMQLWNNTGAKILHAYMKLYNIQIYMKAKYNRRKYL